jgi:hypothetical protein
MNRLISNRRGFLTAGSAAAVTGILPKSLLAAAAPDEQPIFDGIMQYAYIVPDLRQAMEDYTERLGIGPWFLTERFSPPEMKYRGQPTNPDVTIAMTYSGGMNIELIQQRDDTPSVYHETRQKRGFGFHHFGVTTEDFDKDLQAYLDKGDEAAFTITLGGGNRIAYIDTTAYLPGMVELIEVTDGVRAAFGNMHRIARNWDGKTLIWQQ